MTKSKKTAGPGRRPPTLTTAALKPDEKNPRKISSEAAKGLASSMARFGDLSGIVWNKRTEELVAGHQRMRQIEERWGPQQVTLIDQSADLWGIRIDSDHVFTVRVVDWSRAKQRAANVAANNLAIAGEFTDDLSAYLLEVKDEIEKESPGLMDEVLLSSLTKSESGKEKPEATLSESYQIIVQCSGEDHQREVYERLTGQGLACRVLTI